MSVYEGIELMRPAIKAADWAGLEAAYEERCRAVAPMAADAIFAVPM